MANRKQKKIDRIAEMLATYQVLDPTVYVDDHKYGWHEVKVRKALKDLEDYEAPLHVLQVVSELLDAVLSQALNRDPGQPWAVGARQVSGDVGLVGPSGLMTEWRRYAKS